MQRKLSAPHCAPQRRTWIFHSISFRPRNHIGVGVWFPMCSWALWLVVCFPRACDGVREMNLAELLVDSGTKTR